MSSKNRNVQVNMARIQWPDKQNPITHRNNVTVGIPKDSDTKKVYLRIAVDQKTILTEELNKFQWLDESCVDGVVTIESSSSMKIIIFYDGKNAELQSFFIEMKEIIRQKTRKQSSEPVPSSDQIELAINDLVKHIETGSSNDAEFSAKYLTRSRPNVQFNLISHNDNQENEASTKKPKPKPPSNVLQLQLQIECHLDRQPIVSTIFVRSGTNLRALKDQIENETGISRKDQYWYAFDRYLISDDYVFGSTDPVVPPLPKNAPTKLKAPPSDPVRDGDMLIMCIAQMPPFK